MGVPEQGRTGVSNEPVEINTNDSVDRNDNDQEDHGGHYGPQACRQRCFTFMPSESPAGYHFSIQKIPDKHTYQSRRAAYLQTC